MKQTTTALLFLSLFLVGCSESSKKSNNNAYGSAYCTQNPWAAGCAGNNPYLNCSQFPWMQGCQGGNATGASTGGQASGGSNGGGSGGYTGIPSDNNWQALYPEGIPSGYCSSPMEGEGYDLRTGTITLAGGMMYAPNNPWDSSILGDPQWASVNHTHNNSHFLVNVASAKDFLESDGRLKIRFKVRPQPKVGKSDGKWCLGRQTGMSSDPSGGYRSLQFKVSLRPVNPDGTLGSTFIGTRSLSAGVNSCTRAENFSGIAKSYPHGVVVVVHDVKSDQGCWYGENCTAFETVRSASCWSMDIQVSTDTTKDIQ